MTSTSFDFLIIGAGIAGINAAYRLQSAFPHRRFAILEARNSIGGTWDLFRYPGIRSDSDLYTFGLEWFPWNQSNPIAEGGDILRYLNDAAAAANITQHIRFNTPVKSAHWDGHQWTLSVESHGTAEELSAQFVIFATGYYDYHKPLEAIIPGLLDFQGEVIHPQYWPEKFDALGKKIIIIGSGATAVTLVPSLAEDADSVTMLQRSPTYLASVPNARRKPQWANLVPKTVLYYIRRCWYLTVPQLFYQFCRKFPAVAKFVLQKGMKAQLPHNTPLAPHFSPRYNPWQQRLCFCPDGDFFRALRSTKARVETAVIERVEADGIQLTSGKRLEADVIVTATGLRMQLFGGIPIYINGEKLDPSQKYMWNGLMLEDLPNAILVMGFSNASWTLGADLAMRLTCKIVEHMNRQGLTIVVPTLGEERTHVQTRTVMDLTSTYIKRAAKDMPKSSERPPWVSRVSYFSDLYFATFGDFTDGLVFS